MTTTEGTVDSVKRTGPDIAKLRAVYAEIVALEATREELIKAGEKNPLREWSQATWGMQILESSYNQPCGTSFCFAGWAAKLDGCEMQWSGEPHRYLVLESVKAPVDGADWEPVWAYAADALRLTGGQADELFSATNNLDDLKVMIDAIEANPDIEGEELADLAGRYDEDDED